MYHLSKAENNFPFVKVVATLVITPQGARKTAAQQSAEKSLEMNAASQLNYTAPLCTDVHNRAALLEVQMHMIAQASQTQDPHDGYLKMWGGHHPYITLYFLTFQIHISSLFPRQRIKPLPLLVALLLPCPN